MNKIISIIALSTLLFSCNSRTTGEETIKQLTLQELVTSTADNMDELVSFQGIVTHVCKHGGQKMFLTDASKEISFLVRVSESIPEFEVELEGSTVQVTGKLIETLTEIPEVSKTESHTDESINNDNASKAECATEQALEQSGEGETCKTNVSYHLEATSCLEVISE